MSEEARKAAIEQIVKSENYPVAFYRESHALAVGAGRGYDLGRKDEASHTAAIREKAEALVAKVDRLSGLLDKISGEMTDGEHGWMAALEKLEPELTALKAELDKK